MTDFNEWLNDPIAKATFDSTMADLEMERPEKQMRAIARLQKMADDYGAFKDFYAGYKEISHSGIMTVEQVAKRLNISSKRIIQEWLRDGYFPGAFMSNGIRYFDEWGVEEVEESIADAKSWNPSGQPDYDDFMDFDTYERNRWN